MCNSDIGKLQTYIIRLGNWAVENEMKINADKRKAVSFTNTAVKERINYYNGHQLIWELNYFKYLGINIRSSIKWEDYVNYTLGMSLKTFHFIMDIHTKWEIINRNL
jgi:hypothetical protein